MTDARQPQRGRPAPRGVRKSSAGHHFSPPILPLNLSKGSICSAAPRSSATVFTAADGGARRALGLLLPRLLLLVVPGGTTPLNALVT